jgi:hypothetical protein
LETKIYPRSTTGVIVRLAVSFASHVAIPLAYALAFSHCVRWEPTNPFRKQDAALLLLLVTAALHALLHWDILRHPLGGRKIDLLPVALALSLLALGPLIIPISVCTADCWVTESHADAAGAILAPVASLAPLLLAAFVTWPHRRPFKLERGNVLLKRWELNEKVNRLFRAHQYEASDGVDFSGMEMPRDQIAPHYCLCGITESGKTLSVRRMMQFELPFLYPGSNRRALVYNGKGELIPILKGIAPPAPIIDLDPISIEGFAWRIADDIIDPNQAKTAAEVLVPEEQETQKYFPRSARRILEWVLRFLIVHAPGKWNLAVVFIILSDIDLLRAILPAHIVQKYFQPETTFKNTLSTLDTLVSRFETVAAAWEAAEREGNSISIGEWSRSSSILVISRHHHVAQALDPANRLVFQLVAQNILGGPEADTFPQDRRPLISLFLDELGKAGKLPALDDLLLQGRSKGVSAVLAFQSVLSIRAQYREEADALLGQCGNVAIFQLREPETRRWASQLFGEFEGIEEMRSRSTQGGPSNVTYTMHRFKRSTVLDSEFMRLTRPKDTGCLDAYYFTAGVGAYHRCFRIGTSIVPPAPGPALIPRPAEDFELREELADLEIDRLGIRPYLQQHAQSRQTAEQRRARRTRQTQQADDSLRFVHRQTR